MVVALWPASANLEENQGLQVEGKFQPKEVLEALSDAQDSMLADLEEYKKSARDTRSGSIKQATTSRASRCERFLDYMAAVVFD